MSKRWTFVRVVYTLFSPSKTSLKGVVSSVPFLRSFSYSRMISMSYSSSSLSYMRFFNVVYDSPDA